MCSKLIVSQSVTYMLLPYILLKWKWSRPSIKELCLD